MKLVIIIPCFNEEKNLPDVLKTIPKKIPGIKKIETVVIDDGSTDKTVRIARKYDAIVVSHKRNEGLGHAFKTGIEKALTLGVDIIVNIDGDGQFNPLDIPKLVKPILDNGADVVTATRYKNHLSHNLRDRGLKNLGNKFFTLLINRLTSSHFTDVSCGFRAYSKEAALKLSLFGHFTYTHEVFKDLIRKNFTIREVPLKVLPNRKHGESKISGKLFRYGSSALKIIFRSFRDHRPLDFFGVPGILIIVVGLGFNLFFVAGSIITRQTTPFKTYGMIGGFLDIIGFLVIILALVGDMIGRVKDLEEEILYQVKKNNLGKKQ